MKELLSKTLDSKLYTLIWFLIKRRLYPKFCITLILIGVDIITNLEITKRILLFVLNNLDERNNGGENQFISVFSDIWVGIGFIILGLVVFIIFTIRYEKAVKEEEMDSFISNLISRERNKEKFSEEELIFLEYKVPQELHKELMDIFMSNLNYDTKLENLKKWKLKVLNQ